MDINKLLDAPRLNISLLDTKHIDGKSVNNFRMRNDLTVVAMANIMGVSKQTIIKWENGTKKVKGSSAVLLALLETEPKMLKIIYHVEV